MFECLLFRSVLPWLGLAWLGLFVVSQTNTHTTQLIHSLYHTIPYYTILYYRYLGDDWADAVLEDCERYSSYEKLSDVAAATTVTGTVTGTATGTGTDTNVNMNVDVPVRMCWLDNTKLAETKAYPALQEAIRNLYLLPYELNLKCSDINSNSNNNNNNHGCRSWTKYLEPASRVALYHFRT